VGFVGCCSASRLPRLETRDGSEAARAGPTPLTCIPRITKASKTIFSVRENAVYWAVCISSVTIDRIPACGAARPRDQGSLGCRERMEGSSIHLLEEPVPRRSSPLNRLSERRKSAKHQSKKAHPVVRRFLAMNCRSKDHPGSSWESNVVVGPLPQSLTSIPFLDKYK